MTTTNAIDSLKILDTKLGEIAESMTGEISARMEALGLEDETAETDHRIRSLMRWSREITAIRTRIGDVCGCLSDFPDHPLMSHADERMRIIGRLAANHLEYTPRDAS